MVALVLKVGMTSLSPIERSGWRRRGIVFLFDQWRNSSGHNKNMLNLNVRAIGIGRASKSASRYGWYWTTTFGSP